MCKSEIDSQEHLILCMELKKHMKFSHNIAYDQIYGNLEEQISVTILYSSLLEVRERLQEEGAPCGVGTPSCAGVRFAK